MLKNIFNRKSKNKISLLIGLHKITVCHKVGDDVEWLDHQLISNDSEWEAAFSKIVVPHELQGAQVDVVLNHHLFENYEIDKPNVPEAEIAAALPFAIKSLVKGSIFDLVVDYYDKPDQLRKTRQINVVTVQRANVIRIRDMILSAKLTLNSISTVDNALLNLFPPSDHVTLLLSQNDNLIILSIIKQGRLYFSYKMRGFDALLENNLEEKELEEIIERFSLEIQRSLDFVNAQMKLSTIKRAYIAFQTLNDDFLIKKLNGYLGLEMKTYKNKTCRYTQIEAYAALMGDNS